METLGEGGVSIKQVKLKVLYTFDSEHKNNHLARWSQSVDIQAASIDDTTVIGIIHLRTCLDAITNASPELTSNPDNDYTIYAYDYSEPDTPLVGQGMLSKALSQESEDEDNEAMVTGRITKSVMGLFSRNAQETLEVKLRLTPVVASFSRRRSGSISSNADNVQQQWNSLSQTNGAFRPSSPMDTTGLETMQRMLSEGGPRSGNFQKDSFGNQGSRPTSRAGTPTQSQSFSTSMRPHNSESRPSSRAGPTRSHARRDSFNSGYYSGEDNVEDGPARKRAKIQKVDWPSKSNYNIERQSDSLRVTASTASSLRLHRPVAQYPGIAALQNASLEEPVRPPTPIPYDKPKKPRGRPRKVVSPNLLRGPKVRQSSPAQHSRDSAEVSFSSPEEARGDSVTSTPAAVDIPSSPPVMPDQQNFITSPALPPLINETDSGFMSGNLEDLFDDPMLDFGDFLDDKVDGLEQQHFDINEGYEMDGTQSTSLDEADENQQPSVEMPPPVERPERNGHATLMRTQSLGSNQRSLAPAPRLAPAPSSTDNSGIVEQPFRKSTSLPQVPASDPVGGRTFRRANTWAPDMSDAILSDMGPMPDDQSRLKPKKRVGKEQTRARLENAIASGEMPPFCNNCGSIETPAWRRAFIKVFDTPYDGLQTSLEPGECCYKEPMEHDEDGSVKLWRGYRTEKRPEEKSAEVDGWTQICLCNPCGLWFHKFKCPRPPEKWQKRDPNEKRKRKRGPRPKKRPTRPAKSDAPTPASDDSSPADTSAEGDNGEEFGDEMTANEDGNEDTEPQLPAMPRNLRAGSAEAVPRGLGYHMSKKAKTERRVQSSPAGKPVPMHHASVKTPSAVRRQLFPSPQSLQNKVNASLAGSLVKSNLQMPAFVRRSPRLNKTRDYLGTQHHAAMIVTDGEGKENFVPMDEDAMLHQNLFDGEEEEFSMLPMTPTPKRRSERILFRTPGKTPSHDFADARFLNMQAHSPSVKTPKAKLYEAVANPAQRSLDPVEMTPFTNFIHDALQNPASYDFLATPKGTGTGHPRRTPRKAFQGDTHIDFPDLPSLKGSSPMNGTPSFAVGFSEMTTDQIATDYNIFSTDLPMPSSPPHGYFNYVNLDGHEAGSLWDEVDVPQGKDGVGPTLDDAFFSALEDNTVPRRSPRKHKA